MLGEVTTVYVFLIELGSLLLYCYRVFGVRRRIPSTLLMGIACFAVYYAVNKLADNNVAVNIIFGFLVNYVILKLGFKANVKTAVFHSVLLAGVLTATEFIGILLISGFFGNKYSRLQVKRCAVCHGGGNRQNIVPYFLPCDFQFHLA